MNSNNVMHILLVRIALLVALCVIGLGAYTRLVNAGLGCPDWPNCYGHWLWPSSPDEIADANQRWSNNPVILERAVVEVAHRLIAGILILLSVALLWMAKFRKIARPLLGLAATILIVILIQALFGMLTVRWKLWPQIVSAHLLGGFTVLSLLYWYYLRASIDAVVNKNNLLCRRLYPWALCGTVLLLIQIALGAWLSANYAALACPDLPTCQGYWLPPANWREGFNLLQNIGPNYLGGVLDNASRVAIHWTHRIGALVVMFYLLIFATVILYQNKTIVIVRSVYAMLSLLLIQVLLGLANVFFAFPIEVAVAHNLTAALLLLANLRILFLLPRHFG